MPTDPVARPRMRLAALAAVLLPSLFGGCTGAETPGPGTLASNDDPGYSARDAQIIETGEVRKGFLGVGLMSLDAARAGARSNRTCSNCAASSSFRRRSSARTSTSCCRW